MTLVDRVCAFWKLKSEPRPNDARRQEWRRLVTALALAERVHLAQSDKGGASMLHHVARVGFSLLPDIDAAIVGVLHDSVEDGTTEILPAIRALFGNEIAVAVMLLTRQGQPYLDYIGGITRAGGRAGTLARTVKKADLYDNLDADRLCLAALCGANMSPLVERYNRALDLLIDAHEPENPQPA